MKVLKFFATLLLVVASVSCATIVTRSIYPVDFNSNPQGARLTIENRDGRIVFSGHTPTTVHLDASAGYMRPELYKVTYQQPDSEPIITHIEAVLDGWFFGNLLFGGLIGMLIVDPFSGAMYKIPPYTNIINVTNEESTFYSSPSPLAPDWLPLGE